MRLTGFAPADTAVGGHPGTARQVDIAFGIVDLFSGGGLQRDCLRLAQRLRARGRSVTIFTARCEEALRDENVRVLALPFGGLTALTNHGRDEAFGRAFARAAADARCRVGFNKMPGLDFLYCADPPLDQRRRSAWKKWLPRYRLRRRLEEACFSPRASTEIFLLTEKAASDYRAAWNTPAERIAVLPPSIAPERIRPDLRAQRPALRQALGLGENDLVALWIGAQPHTKGLDRVLRTIEHMPQWSLVLAGPDATTVQTLLARIAPSAAGRVHALGFREDIPVLMAAADVLVHPARLDTTGQVILEALANGLPVIASAACGFAEHVANGGGVVLAEPFAEADLQAALTDALDQGHREGWSRAALAHVARLDVINGLDRAADAIASARQHTPTLPDRDKLR